MTDCDRLCRTKLTCNGLSSAILYTQSYEFPFFEKVLLMDSLYSEESPVT